MTSAVQNGQLDPSENWFDDYAEDDAEEEVAEYDITASPNDFNITTLFSFIESGSVIIPGFQRNFVWDIRRSSKLIESLILGLPVPQIFLYEEARNRFLVIDGQQRLMSIYYFIKQRFPRNNVRTQLRSVFEEHGKIPDAVLEDEQYFSNFRLQLPSGLPSRPNKFHGLSYSTLGEYAGQFNLRPIRNVIVKQNVPRDDDSSIYEIFSRLNSGGVNLRPQEIRLSLYHSDFYEMLVRVNGQPEWRRLLQNPEPDLHMKDVEILLRIFAMLVDSEAYAPSMTKFLNQFSRKSQSNTNAHNDYMENFLISFLSATEKLPNNVFINKRNRRFNIALIEAVFSAVCKERFALRESISGHLDLEQIQELETDEEFVRAASVTTTSTANVSRRLQRGYALIDAL